MPERLAREQSCYAALERLAELRLAEGDSARAIAHLRRLAAADPLRESAHRLLMRALATAGEYAAVVQAYRELRLMLQREMRADPDPETSALYRTLRADARRRATQSSQERNEPTPVAATHEIAPTHATHRGQLPRQLTSFVGREDDLWALKERVQRERLLTLLGPGGIGKTRLAIQVAHEAAVDFAHDAWFVDLAPLTEGTHIVPALVAVLGLREHPGVPLQQTLREYLQTRSALLILDNCEHLSQDCALLAADLLEHCPDVHLLVTSREPLHLAGEHLWRVATLPTPDPATLRWTEKGEVGALLEYDAVRLFVDRAQQYRADFHLTQQNAGAVVQICYDLDGLALAVELAAVRIKVLSVAEIAVRLKHRFRMLTGGGRNVPARHQTLQAVLDWSYDLLSKAEQELLRQLSVFVGGWTLAGACAPYSVVTLWAMPLRPKRTSSWTCVW